MDPKKFRGWWMRSKYDLLLKRLKFTVSFESGPIGPLSFIFHPGILGFDYQTAIWSYLENNTRYKISQLKIWINRNEVYLLGNSYRIWMITNFCTLNQLRIFKKPITPMLSGLDIIHAVGMSWSKLVWFLVYVGLW